MLLELFPLGIFLDLSPFDVAHEFIQPFLRRVRLDVHLVFQHGEQLCSLVHQRLNQRHDQQQRKENLRVDDGDYMRLDYPLYPLKKDISLQEVQKYEN